MAVDDPDLKPMVFIGWLVVLLLWETASPYLTFPGGRRRLVHGSCNLVFGLLNALVTSVVFAALWWTTAEAAAAQAFGFLHRVVWPPVLEMVTALLLLDAWTYAWHRMNHRIPLLWRFHRVHHSDPYMDVTTASRFHLGEILLSSVLRIPLIFLLGLGVEHLALYETLLLVVVQFHHANISIGPRGDRLLSWFLVTPFLHKVHHSRWQPETDSNYASILPMWDRLFGTFRFPKNPRQLRFGLDDFATLESQSVRGMLLTPLVTVSRRTAPASSKDAEADSRTGGPAEP